MEEVPQKLVTAGDNVIPILPRSTLVAEMGGGGGGGGVQHLIYSY